MESTICSSGWALQLSGQGNRKSIVSLFCDEERQNPVFIFVEEKPQKTYHFDLMHRSACPQIDEARRKAGMPGLTVGE